MQTFIDHARSFGRSADRSGKLAALARGQAPQALFITCSDSRVIPSLITGARPGELFELRTAGNIVPPYTPGHPSSEAATIEYAIDVLGIRDIVVCGHSHCGAVGALVRGDDLTAVPAVRDWLAHAAGEPGGPAAGDRADADDPAVERAVHHHVLTQVLRLRSYPCVERHEVRLHGWYYEVHTGTVLAHQGGSDMFEAL
ncbi:carbonic anhydrase (plasmid) [Streptomyces clavuligerus]|uniref:Carbonic anhydrase n=2 Tax=Streptomyces clavuligerus TaxID=1901 RepID=B5GNC8_STRCL|nr:carbonic anhydrase [Streptomyces clavuligerus]ANW22137.1 carbonic anhydrase [Streptomyces clavuligerus]AXU17029.1 carbonic anhydrase [Streptomyces clavuligerus]EDY47824.1 carbonic anhydrase [Streptomyces clavuligerus]EFG04190.1 carbonic anhydrase [Streptomyces clavuligerus]MBY6307330.1 carbonic anhydrase [Streptomyces clavuligerus]